jgi:voltage-gated potassium channel Kch/predicted Rossmann-fold nucleotide-binding protein
MTAWYRSRGVRRHRAGAGGAWLSHLTGYVNTWRAILVAFVLALGLGIWGFSLYFHRKGDLATPIDILHASLQLFTLNYGFQDPSWPYKWLPVPLEIARLLAPAVAIYSILKGLLLAFRDQVDRFRLSRWSGHVVICGLGVRGHVMAQGFLDRGYAVAAIERDPGNAFIEPLRERGTIVLIGDAAHPGVLRKAAVAHAQYLLCVCGNDGTNVAAASQADRLIREHARRSKQRPHLKVLADISDAIYESVRANEIVDTQESLAQVEFFDLYERAAHEMFDRFPPFQDTDAQPHILIVGLGRLGKHLIIRAAREWRHRLKVDGKPPRKMTARVVDLDATAQIELLRARCPDITDFCELTATSMDVRSVSFQKGEYLRRIAPGDLPDIAYICLSDDALALPTAVTISEHLREKCARDVEIVVRFYESGGHDAVLRYAGSQFLVCPRLNAFCMADVASDPDSLVTPTSSEMMAQAIHGAYCLHQKRIGQTVYSSPSMVPWRQLSAEMRASNMAAAADMGHKLAAVYCGAVPLVGLQAQQFEFGPEQRALLARMEQMRWRRWWEQRGWKSDAENPERRDPAAKIRPYLVPWEQLPEKAKGYNLAAVRRYVPEALEHAGFEIVRLIEPTSITLPGGNKASVARLCRYVRASLILESLAIRLPGEPPRDDLPEYRKTYETPKAAIVVVGGAAGMGAQEMQRVEPLYVDGLARLASEQQVALVTGGTDIGVMHLAGQGMATHERTAPIVGVCPEARVHWPGKAQAGDRYALEPHHSHFVFTPGADFGSESFMIYEIMKELERGVPSLALLANGGEIAKREALTSVRHGRPLVVLKGSGRTADEIAAAVEAQETDDPVLRPFLDYARLWVFDVQTGTPEQLMALLSEILFSPRWWSKLVGALRRGP